MNIYCKELNWNKWKNFKDKNRKYSCEKVLTVVEWLNLFVFLVIAMCELEFDFMVSTGLMHSNHMCTIANWIMDQNEINWIIICPYILIHFVHFMNSKDNINKVFPSLILDLFRHVFFFWFWVFRTIVSICNAQTF